MRRAPRGRLRFLIVDDERSVRLVLADLVAGEGHEVAAAASCAEALALIEQGMNDVVLIDWCLGSESGLDLLEEITRRWPRTRCVLMSGNGAGDFEEQAQRRGACGCLGKPFRIQELFWLVDSGEAEVC